MLALLVAATLAQTAAPPPSVGLFLRPGPGGLKPSLRESVLTSVATVLAEVGLPVSVDAREADNRLRRAEAESCTSRVDCLFRIARVIEVDVLIAIEATDFEGDVAVALEAVAHEGERRLARHSSVLRSTEVGRKLRGQLDDFSQELREAMGTKPQDAPLANAAPVRVSEPAVAAISPALPSAPSAMNFATPHPLRRSRVPAFAAVGGAALAGGAAIAFGLNGLNLWSQSHSNVDNRLATHTYPQASNLSESANQNFTASAISAGVSAALTGLAVLLWQ